MSSTIQTTRQTTFSAAERRMLSAMRARYAESHDLFSAVELARLSFLRWLYTSGRLAP